MGAACVPVVALVNLVARPSLTNAWSSWGVFPQYLKPAVTASLQMALYHVILLQIEQWT